MRQTAGMDRRPQPPDAQEAAAIAAALERFLTDTLTPVPTGPPDGLRGWARAAMLEGVQREDHGDVPHPWINT